MNPHRVARSTFLLGMELRIQVKYTVVDDSKTLWEKLASAYISKLKLNIFELGKTFAASSYRTAEMSTITNRGSIGKSRIKISPQSRRPLTLTLLTLMCQQRQSPR
jgi:hypothetical protein